MIASRYTYLGGERPGGKRGRGAAGKTPIVAAVETTAERKPRRLRLTVVKGFRRQEIEKLAKRDLAPGSNVVSDGLSCWPAVAKAGCCHFPPTAPPGRGGSLRDRIDGFAVDGHRLRPAGCHMGAVPVGEHDAG